jgi:predicted glycoside hydrolase/deacetylase ChbG (UPF0249 family)
MSAVDDIRKLFQDFLAPELTAIKISVENAAKIADARWAAEQTQYATLMTHMELIRAEIKNNNDYMTNKLNELTKEKAGTR